VIRHYGFVREWILSFAVALLTAVMVGCLRSPILSPEEAVEQTAECIDKVIREWRGEDQSPTLAFESAVPRDPHFVVFWYFAHPIIGPAFSAPDQIRRFEETHPNVRLEARFIGEWVYAMQKLAVSLAADDLPDIALIKRDWLGPLVSAGRLAPMGLFLSEEVLEDFPENVRVAHSANGMMYALPADGFCGVLLCNAQYTDDQLPTTWDELRSLAEQTARARGDQTTGTIGFLPFLELFWSAGGKVNFESDKNSLDKTAALETLQFLSRLRAEGLLYPRSSLNEIAGLELLSRGKVAFTVASSAYLPQLRGSGLTVRVGPVPGKSGPISRFSGNVLVVFSKYAEAKRDAIAAVLQYLISDDLQNNTSWEQGSVPTRVSLQQKLGVSGGLMGAFRVARDAPIIRPWAVVEDQLQRLPAAAGF